VLRFAGRRALQGLIVVLGVTIVVFVVTRMVSDPVDFILPLSASEEQREARREELGFNRPIHEQFADYVGDVARFDFGESTYYRGEDTMEVVLDALPRTFQLIGLGMFIALVVSLPLGMIAALRPGRLLDRFLVTISLLGLSMPQFFMGQLLLILFAVHLQWFQPGPGDWQTHLILPALTLALPAIGRLSMVIRSAMIDELNTQYVKTAKAKGLRRSRIVSVHALRNAAIPFVTLFGWEVIRALAGYTVVVETVFGWPGLGLTAITAVKERDFFLLQTIVLVVAVMVVAVNVLIDLTYKAIDPRVKLT
jgi:peptide/nickel transport system permease protein